MTICVHKPSTPTIFAALLLLFLTSVVGKAQGTAFSYQGKLTDAGNPANGSYDIQFKLFDTPTVGTGAQQGSTITNPTVTVSSGILNVTLDFGANVFNGSARYLEMGVRPAGNVNPYTVLSPRQPITPSPYAIQTIRAASADTLSVSCVACVQDAQINSVAGSKVSGLIPVNSVPASSGNYIQNTSSPQAGANFNISGNGTLGALNANGAFSLGGMAPPAVAPAGQGRIYFDSASNKLRVSENGGSFLNLIGAGGVSGSGTTNTIPLWSAGTTLGNSVITQAGSNVGIGTAGPLSKLHILSGASDLPPRLQSPGTTSFGAGWDFYHGATGKGYVGVPDPSAGFGAGELLLFGGPGTKTSLWAGSTRSVTIDTNGNVGIGTTTTTLARLQVSDTSFGTGVYGTTSTNGRGVTGENTGSSNGAGVLGVSATGSGVLGQGASLFAGVQGDNNNVSGIGVLGKANVNGGVGVLGQSNVNIGVYGQSTSGVAMRADGNTLQQRDKGGWVKAMVSIASNGVVGRCFNSFLSGSAASTPPCGISVSHIGLGEYQIDFGFLVTDRFFSALPIFSNGRFIGINRDSIFGNVVGLATFYLDTQDQTDSPFYLIVY